MTQKLLAGFSIGLLLLVQWDCTNNFTRKSFVIETRKQLGAVQSFAISYNRVSLSHFRPFDLVILDPDAYTAEDFRELNRQGKIVLGYLNVGEIETYRWYASEIPRSWYLESNPNWPNHTFVNVKKSGWRKLVTQKIAPRILQKGARGLFLDSVDLASPTRKPQLKSAMVKLVRQIAREFPDKILVLNNGQFLLPDVAPVVSGLAVENIFTRPRGKSVVCRPAGQVQEILDTLSHIQRNFHVPIFLIDYFPPNGEELVTDWIAIAHTYGMVLYVSDVLLQHISTPIQ